MRKIYGGLLLLLFIYFSSCNSDSQIADRILHSVENIAEQYPDSALALMDSIENPYLLNQGLQAKYWTLLVESKYKVGTDISYDTLIFNAKAYFKKTHNIKYLALSTFYSGRVLESLQKPQEAMSAFIEAESIATAAKDTSLTGFIRYNIGDTYYKKGLYDEAIVKFKQSAGNFANRQNDYKKEIMALDYIGANFVMKNNIDSALFYFNSALSKVNNSNDSTEMTNILLNMGSAFLKLKKTDEAKIKLIEAKKYSKDPIQQAKINLNLANVYVSENRLDSADVYIRRSMELAEKTEDKALQVSAWYYLSRIDEKRGNYKASLDDYKKYAVRLSSVYEEAKKVNYLDVQKKYDFELIRNANEGLLIGRQKMLILFLTATLALMIVAFLFYRKKKRDEKVILSAKQEILQLKEIINDSVHREADSAKIRKTLASYFGIFKRIALLEDAFSEKEKENEKIKVGDLLKRIYNIVYGHSGRYDWKVLVDTLNDLYAGYADRLREKAPQLTEIEYRICCLSKSGLSNSEIGSLLNKTENAIELQKTCIRNTLKLQKQSNFNKELDKFVEKY